MRVIYGLTLREVLVLIREAYFSDYNSIQYLYELLCPDESTIQVLPERIEQIRQDHNNYLFVYEQDDLVVGTVFLTICLNPMYGKNPTVLLRTSSWIVWCMVVGLDTNLCGMRKIFVGI